MLALVEGVTDKGVECALLLRHGDPLADQYRSRGIPVFHTTWVGPPANLLSLRLLAFVLMFLPSLWQMRKSIKQSGADIVHINTSTNLVCGLAARLCAKPVVWHVRDCLDGALFSLVCRSIDVLADRVIAISDLVRRRYLTANPGSIKCSRIYNGVTVVDPGTGDKTSEYFDIILPARIEPAKGQLSLLMALTHLPESLLAKTRVRFYGTVATWKKEYLATLHNYVQRHQLVDVVSFNDYSRCIEAEIARADVLVQCSSMREPFGRTMVEAMLLSTLVAAADNGAATEIIDHGRTGFLYHAGDPEDLAGQLVKISEMSEEKAQNIRQTARKKALDEFSMPRLIDEVLRVYGDMEACSRRNS